ncbi:MAG: aminodeoxyfutalosine synthase [Phycisphaerales bacterium]|nr:MAG: aminodeoxyfutalosine synthase [Phycisphaerales bacterium]
MTQAQPIHASARPTDASSQPRPLRFSDPALEPIAQRVLAGERLSLEQGQVLYETDDLWGVLSLADAVRRRLHGSAGYYNINRHFNYSNVCSLSCKFCEFYRKKDQPGAYTRTIEDVRAQALQAVESGATEIHIVGGLHPYLPWSYYPQMLQTIREVAPQLHIKAFTAVEIVHLARIARKYRRADRRESIRWVLGELKQAGLGSLPGGGAEVFDDRVHDQAFKGKIRSDEWLDVHLVAHELGLNTNATILYGHIDQRRERLVHMEILRRAQDQALERLGYQGLDGQPVEPGLAATADVHAPVITLTRPGTPLPTPAMAQEKAGYFQTIIPLPFIPDGSALEHLYGPTGLENLRTIAIARLMLDNFPHVKAFWIMHTLGMAQLMLEAGADDIDGTVVWYDITKVGGAGTHQEASVADLRRAIIEAGLTPIERDTLYRPIQRDGRHWRVVA